MTLRLQPISLSEAKDFVTKEHRHHRPPVGHKFSIGVCDDDVLVGVVIVGRPSARLLDDGYTLEVTRTTTDGTANVNSMLYGAAARAGFAMGFTRIVTYTQDPEPGASLKAAGWRVVASRAPRRKGWDTPSRPRTGNGNDNILRHRWEKQRINV